MSDDVISQPGGSGTSKDASAKPQQDDRRKPGFEPTQDEKDTVKGWLERAQRAESNTAFKEWQDLLEELRAYVSGVKHDDKTNKKLTRSNMVYATIAAMMPKLYAKNPDIGVVPSDAVPESSMGNIKRFGETAETVLHKMLVEEGRLKKRAKANIRSACGTSIGVLKLTYQKELRGDPLVIRRIEDTQDQLARVETLAQQLKKEDDPVQIAQKRDELRANLKALGAHNEVRIFKGFAVDRLKSEDFLILDESVVEFDEYVDARALAQRTWMTVKQAEVLFEMKMDGATRYGRPRTNETASATSTGTADQTPPGEMFVCVLEIWDKENGVVRTVVKGMNRWVREPYAPQHSPQRWYPFYVLGFNVIEGRWRPISDVELLKQLQDEYNTTRTNYADVREKAVPKTVIRKGGNLSEQDVKNVMDSGNKDWVAVEGNPTVPIGQDIMRLEGVKIDPQAYDVTLIRNDMDLMVGLSDASRSNLIKPKTATEAELMQEALNSRVDERRDANEDLMSEMAEAALEIVLQDLSKAEVQQIAGEDAEWPDAPESVEQVFRQVVVRVRAGSTGKPNQAKEREQWTQLLPQIGEAMKQVNDLRVAGNYELADAVVQLLRETLKRFDEHVDLDSIIPPIQRDKDGKPVAAQQAAMEVVQLRQQLEECKQQLAKCEADLQKAKAGDMAKAEQARVEGEREAAVAAREAESQRLDAERQAAEAMREADRQAQQKIAQDNAKAETERTRQLEIQTKDKLERERMDKEFDLKQKALAAEKAAAVEIARINAEAKAGILEGMPQSKSAINELMQTFADFIGADRIIEYGKDGMPTGMKVVPKKKPAAAKPADKPKTVQ
jgi:hypothetical protein